MAALLRIDQPSLLQLFDMIIALVAPDLHQLALLDGLLVGDDGQGPDQRGGDLLGGKRNDSPRQSVANLHGVAIPDSPDLQSRLAGGILGGQFIRQPLCLFSRAAGEIDKLLQADGPARGE